MLFPLKTNLYFRPLLALLTPHGNGSDGYLKISAAAQTKSYKVDILQWKCQIHEEYGA